MLTTGMTGIILHEDQGNWSKDQKLDNGKVSGPCETHGTKGGKPLQTISRIIQLPHNPICKNWGEHLGEPTRCE